MRCFTICSSNTAMRFRRDRSKLRAAAISRDSNLHNDCGTECIVASFAVQTSATAGQERLAIDAWEGFRTSVQKRKSEQSSLLTQEVANACRLMPERVSAVLSREVRKKTI